MKGTPNQTASSESNEPTSNNNPPETTSPPPANSTTLKPFWRKPGSDPTYAPSWFQNQSSITTEVFYDNNVSAANNGGRLEQILESAKPGDHIVIHAGTYSIPGALKISVASTASAPTVIKGAPGERVVITRADRNQNNLEILGGSQYLLLENIVFDGASVGIRFMGGTSEIMVYNCELTNTGTSAITANSGNTSYLYFVDNHIHHTHGEAEGFYLGANYGANVTHHTKVIGNYIHDIVGPTVTQGDGIEIKEGSYAVEVKYNFIENTNYPGIIVYGTGRGAADRNVIEENVVIGSNDYAIQAAGEAIIRNNLVIGGVNSLGSQPHQNSTPKHLTIANNTFVNSGTTIRLSSWNGGSATNIELMNNVFYSSASSYIQGSTGVAIVKNNVNINNLNAFVNLSIDGSKLDATPAINSPLIGAGDPLFTPLHDLLGRIRVGSVEVGAVDLP